MSPKTDSYSGIPLSSVVCRCPLRPARRYFLLYWPHRVCHSQAALCGNIHVGTAVLPEDFLQLKFWILFNSSVHFGGDINDVKTRELALGHGLCKQAVDWIWWVKFAYLPVTRGTFSYLHSGQDLSIEALQLIWRPKAARVESWLDTRHGIQKWADHTVSGCECYAVSCGVCPVKAQELLAKPLDMTKFAVEGWLWWPMCSP